jgi:putative hydrolase
LEDDVSEKFGFGPDDGEGSSSGDPADSSDSSQKQPSFNFDIDAILQELKKLGLDTPEIPEQMRDQLNSLASMAENFMGSGNMADFSLSIETIREIARKTLAKSGELPLGDQDLKAMKVAIEIADHWVDQESIFPRTKIDPARSQAASTRSDWINFSIQGWQSFITPFVEGLSAALGKVFDQFPEGEIAALGQINPPKLMASFMATMIRTQLGQSIGKFATTVTSANDVAIPLSDKGAVFLIPENVRAWGIDLGVEEREIEIFLALRESAAARLFAHTPWLSEYLQKLLTQYGQGISIDVESMQSRAEEAIASGEIDISSPESMQNAITEGIFTPQESDAQKSALNRLELILALIEGWIDLVVEKSAGERLPALLKLQETQRRRRATQSPTQQLFASLVGLEVSPRTIRECAKFWRELSEMVSLRERDQLWEDPFALPTADEIADPQIFLSGRQVPDDLSNL